MRLTPAGRAESLWFGAVGRVTPLWQVHITGAAPTESIW